MDWSYEQEISQLIGTSLTVDDEDAILAELAEIEREEAAVLEAALPEAPTPPLEPGASKALGKISELWQD